MQVSVYTAPCSSTLKWEQRVYTCPSLHTCVHVHVCTYMTQALGRATFSACPLGQGRHYPRFGGEAGEGLCGSQAERLPRP